MLSVVMLLKADLPHCPSTGSGCGGTEGANRPEWRSGLIPAQPAEGGEETHWESRVVVFAYYLLGIHFPHYLLAVQLGSLSLPPFPVSMFNMIFF